MPNRIGMGTTPFPLASVQPHLSPTILYHIGEKKYTYTWALIKLQEVHGEHIKFIFSSKNSFFF